MKNKIPILSLCAFAFLNPRFSNAQHAENPVDKAKPEQLEKLGDHYIPNAYGNKKTSPPYTSTSATLRNTNVFTMQVNVDSNGQNIIGDAANEPNIAVNPQNEDEIVIGWRQFDNVISNFRQAGWSYTSDGGQTWTFPGVIEPGVFRSDPVLDFDSSGNFYYNSLTLDNFGNFLCKVFKSDDGGSSWDNGTSAYGGDKQWMTIDRSAGTGSGNIYAFWTYAYSDCAPGFFTRSTDDGDSYESCTQIGGYPFWGTLAVGINGELYIAGNDGFGNMEVVKSLNVQYADSSVTWQAPVQVDMDGFFDGSGINEEGLQGQANIDVDRSNGAGSGNVYVLASMTRTSNPDPADIMFSKSTDGGATWSAPVRVNDDNSQSNTQWFGTMSVAPNGRIDAIWLDTRDSPGYDSSALYYSYSLDQGDTWSANEKISDSFNPHVGYPNQNKMGDYFDMVSDDYSANLAWANTLNGEEDVYYSRITPGVAVTVNGDPLSTFSITPNPSAGKIIVSVPSVNGINQGKPMSAEIFNQLGEKLFTQPLVKSKSELDISSQPSGIYLVKIIDAAGNSVVKKMVKD